MTFTQFLQAFAFNFFASTLPFCVFMYFTIRLAISHGEVSFRKKQDYKYGMSNQVKDFKHPASELAERNV